MSGPPLSRRTALRGMGTAVALPLLDAMLPARAFWSGSPAQVPRLAYVYVPNGVHVPDWTPREEGAGFGLPWILEPLQPFRSDFTVLSGLTSDKARANGDGPGDHARAAAVFLTGVQPYKPDGKVRVGPSADQVAAAALGDPTPFRSLVLGCDRSGNSGQCDSGYACAYSSNISWQSGTTPAAKSVNPRQVFDRLFRGGEDALASAARAERRERRRSVLDYVRGEATRLRKRLGADDRQKLEEYFSGIRELERRIARASSDRVEAVPDEARPAGIPTDLGEHIRLLGDLIVHAFATDQTRIATFLVTNEGSNRPYREVEVPEGHHDLSHHGQDPGKQEKIRRINRFHVEQLAWILGRLAETREGDQRLLDAVMLVYGSDIGDGNRHNHDELPILLCGGGAGTLHPGRHVRHPRETPLANLHVALLDRMGVPVEAHGDSTGPLEGI